MGVLAWVALAAATAWLVRAEQVEPADPAGVRVERDLVYRIAPDGRKSRLDVLRPDAEPPATGWPVLVALHGGGWRGGSKADYGASLVELVRAGNVVVAVDYRLSRPGRPSWPDNLDDVRAALLWVDREAGRRGFDRRRAALIGASAGAHLALLAAFDPADRPAGSASASRGEGGGPIRVGAVVDFYGPTSLVDLAPARAAVETMLGVGPSGSVAPGRLAAASPLERVGPGVPPVLILHGTDDLVVPLDQSRRLAEALGRAGVVHRLQIVDGARHGFGLHAGTRDFVPEILAFLARAWKDGESSILSTP